MDVIDITLINPPHPCILFMWHINCMTRWRRYLLFAMIKYIMVEGIKKGRYEKTKKQIWSRNSWKLQRRLGSANRQRTMEWWWRKHSLIRCVLYYFTACFPYKKEFNSEHFLTCQNWRRVFSRTVQMLSFKSYIYSPFPFKYFVNYQLCQFTQRNA